MSSQDAAGDEAEKWRVRVRAASLEFATAALNLARHDPMLHQTHARGGLHRLTNKQRRKNFHKQARECAELIAAMNATI